MRKINVWTKLVEPELFIPEFIEPATGKTNASVWSKHKQTGLVTGGMRRGKAMRDYRLLITGL